MKQLKITGLPEVEGCHWTLERHIEDTDDGDWYEEEECIFWYLHLHTPDGNHMKETMARHPVRWGTDVNYLSMIENIPKVANKLKKQYFQLIEANKVKEFLSDETLFELVPEFLTPDQANTPEDVNGGTQSS